MDKKTIDILEDVVKSGFCGTIKNKELLEDLLKDLEGAKETIRKRNLQIKQLREQSQRMADQRVKDYNEIKQLRQEVEDWENRVTTMCMECK